MRPEIVGPDEPETPYPVVVATHVTSGFGRGSAELGIPTANIPPGLLADLDPGVYFGWAVVEEEPTPEIQATESRDHRREVEYNFGTKLGPAAGHVWPMVMSIGWNPYYKNSQKSAEVHILHKFNDNFYGCRIRVAVCGYIRPEQSYDSLDALISDIRTDIQVAERSLERPAYQRVQELIANSA